MFLNETKIIPPHKLNDLNNYTIDEVLPWTQTRLRPLRILREYSSFNGSYRTVLCSDIFRHAQISVNIIFVYNAKKKHPGQTQPQTTPNGQPW